MNLNTYITRGLKTLSQFLNVISLLINLSMNAIILAFRYTFFIVIGYLCRKN